MNYVLRLSISLFVLIVVSGFFSCENRQKSNHNLLNNEQQLKDTLEKVNKYYVQKESDEIDQYIKLKGWEMNTTGTGLRYTITTHGKGDSAKAGMVAKVNYTIKLLDGTICYTSLEKGPKDFLIGQDYVESGIHEGIQLLKVGDKARFVLPSHLAHGFTGDDNKIPPKATLVIELELLSVKK